MTKKLPFKYALLLGMSISLVNLWGQVTTFSYTGAVQTYTVPIGVTSIQLETWGAQSGTGIFGGITPNPGLGGYAVGALEVTPGDILNIYVGGAGASSGLGGFNGGGQAGTDYGASGGGASDVRLSPYTLTDRIIVGAGGGGAAFGSTPSDGGHGGALIGIAGENGDFFVGGGGGTQVAGGAAGCCYGGAIGGIFGIGGGPGDYHNAGGGGGWYGGGSGAGQAGAGGGSSYIAGVTDGITTAGLRSGNGEIVITVLCTPLTVTVSSAEICFGEAVTLEGSSGLGGSVTWDGGVVNGEAFIPPVGTTTYTATSDADGDCSFSVEILVVDLPTVEATVDLVEICLGETVIFGEAGADTYVWDPADIVAGDSYSPADAGLFSYTLTGTDDVTGCSNSSTIEFTVNTLPTVIANVSDDEICLTDEIIFTGDGAETYSWSPVAIMDGVAYAPAAIGTATYTVVGVDANGCENSASVAVTVFDQLLITYTTSDELYGTDGSINITVTGGNPTYIFDWDNDETGDFDDTEDLNDLSSGTYIVVVNDEAGCSATEMISLNSQLEITSNNAQLFSIYPNPTTNQITIAAEGNFTYQLVAINGEEIANGKGFNQTTFSLVDLADGIYFVTLTANNSTNTVKVIKQ